MRRDPAGPRSWFETCVSQSILINWVGTTEARGFWELTWGNRFVWWVRLRHVSDTLRVLKDQQVIYNQTQVYSSKHISCTTKHVVCTTKHCVCPIKCIVLKPVLHLSKQSFYWTTNYARFPAKHFFILQNLEADNHAVQPNVSASAPHMSKQGKQSYK